MPPKHKLITLNVETDILTAQSTADIVNEILELLLVQRQQIPFSYKLYQQFTNDWAETKKKEETSTTVMRFQLERERELATQTRNSIRAMQQLILKSFEQSAIKKLRFLFGATSFTPKEVYTVHIPWEAVTHRHNHQQHELSQNRLSQIMLSLITSEDLQAEFTSKLCPTNLYLELEMVQSHALLKVSPKEIAQLPRSCKDIHLLLVHNRPLNFNDATIQCCNNLSVFKDLDYINDDDGTDQLKGEQINSLGALAWWEADIIVRGFKEKPIKGVNMWSK